ncbi:MAG: hypothetical protein R3C61_19530 [Bacteroidia bacterium]
MGILLIDTPWFFQKFGEIEKAMILLIIGKNKEILSAFAENIRNVETIIISSISPEALFHKYQCIWNHIRLVIVDFNNYHIFRENENQVDFSIFPSTKEWAIYEAGSRNAEEKLKQMGFEKIISYEDDLASLIDESGLFA